MKKSISLLLVLVLCCIPLFGFNEAASVEQPSGEASSAGIAIEEVAMSDNESRDIPETFMQKYGERLYSQSRSHILSDILVANGLHSSNRNNYPWPPAFGGTYLDKNGIYVVCVVDDDPEFKAYITSLFEGTGVPYYFQSVTYSWNYLTELKQEISDLLRAGGSLALAGNVTIYGAKQDINAVSVGMKDVSEEAIALFREIISDSPAIVFVFQPFDMAQW